jgi:hypothetical protein
MDEDLGPEIARGMRVPYDIDGVAGPELVYGVGLTALYFETPEGEPVRVTFERLDAFRACRGEYLPYEDDWSMEGAPTAVFIIENSRWLRERHAYEARYYQDCYEFGGNVDEMLTEYDHYLFQFHDEFVEATARGIWFEKHPMPLKAYELPEHHPLRDLPITSETGYFDVDGVNYQIRTNPNPMEEIRRGAFYCTQPLYHFASERDGFGSVWCRVDIRERRGVVRSYFRGGMGVVHRTVEGVVTLEQAQELAAAHMRKR